MSRDSKLIDITDIIDKEYNDGASISIIALRHGVGVTTIRNYLTKCGLYVKGQTYWRDEEEDVIIQMRLQGKTYKEISDVLGRTPYAVMMRVCKLRAEGKVGKKLTKAQLSS